MYEKERRIRTFAPSYVFDFFKSVSQKFAGIFTIILGSVVSLVIHAVSLTRYVMDQHCQFQKALKNTAI
jgi:hypothetical protein